MLRALIVLLVLAAGGLLAVSLLPSSKPAERAAAPVPEAVPPVWQAGTHWHEVEVPADARRQAGTPIPVVCVFSYAAPNAHAFELALRGWVGQLPADVAFSRLAVAGNAEWRRHARNYYTLQAMGADDSTQLRMFEVVARRPRSVLTPSGVVNQVLSDADAAAFRAAFTSPQVIEQIDRADQLLPDWQLADIPALLIDNRYVVQLGDVGVEGTFEVAELLLERARAERLASARQAP